MPLALASHQLKLKNLNNDLNVLRIQQHSVFKVRISKINKIQRLKPTWQCYRQKARRKIANAVANDEISRKKWDIFSVRLN